MGPKSKNCSLDSDGNVTHIYNTCDCVVGMIVLCVVGYDSPNNSYDSPYDIYIVLYLHISYMPHKSPLVQ